MKTLTTLTITTLFALTLNACAGETVYAHDNETGGQGGESTVISAQGTAKDGSSAVTTTTETAEPELLCVPGASVGCACPGGTKGAQACAKDGMSYGVCACEAKIVTETVIETVTETPEGYSGECLRLGATVATTEGACDLQTPVLYVNCKTKPGPTSVGCRVPYNYALLENVPGVYCCTQ